MHRQVKTGENDVRVRKVSTEAKLTHLAVSLLMLILN